MHNSKTSSLELSFFFGTKYSCISFMKVISKGFLDSEIDNSKFTFKHFLYLK